MKKILTTLPVKQKGKPSRFRRFGVYFLTPFYWLIAHAYATPGLNIHRYVFQIMLRLFKERNTFWRSVRQLLFFPMDSVRYFELDFVLNSISKTTIGNFLDLSSPRLLPLLVLERLPVTSAVLVNPDHTDLEITRKLLTKLGLDDRCEFSGVTGSDLDFPAETFDTVTCISVIEHVPGDGDVLILKKLWELLKPGGKLYLTIPCAAEAIEEFIDFDEYGILEPDSHGFVFGQRVYDEKLLLDRVFEVIGRPLKLAVYGEKIPGSFIENRAKKNSDPTYPSWREPYMMGREFAYFDSVDDLPGWGVVAMEFQKIDSKFGTKTNHA